MFCSIFYSLMPRYMLQRFNWQSNAVIRKFNDNRMSLNGLYQVMLLRV